MLSNIQVTTIVEMFSPFAVNVDNSLLKTERLTKAVEKMEAYILERMPDINQVQMWYGINNTIWEHIDVMSKASHNVTAEIAKYSQWALDDPNRLLSWMVPGKSSTSWLEKLHFHEQKRAAFIAEKAAKKTAKQTNPGPEPTIVTPPHEPDPSNQTPEPPPEPQPEPQATPQPTITIPMDEFQRFKAEFKEPDCPDYIVPEIWPYIGWELWNNRDAVVYGPAGSGKTLFVQ